MKDMVSNIYTIYWGIVLRDEITVLVIATIASLVLILYIGRMTNPSLIRKGMLPPQERNYGPLLALKKRILVYFLVYTIPVETTFFLVNLLYVKINSSLFNLIMSVSSPTLPAALKASSQVLGFVGVFGTGFLIPSVIAYIAFILYSYSRRSISLYGNEGPRTDPR